MKRKLFKVQGGVVKRVTLGEMKGQDEIIRVCVSRAGWLAKFPETRDVCGDAKCADCKIDVVYRKDEMPLLPNMVPLCLDCAHERLVKADKSEPDAIVMNAPPFPPYLKK